MRGQRRGVVAWWWWQVMIILIREFQTPDEEMKKIVLKVVAQCVATEGVEPDYIRQVNSYEVARTVAYHALDNRHTDR